MFDFKLDILGKDLVVEENDFKFTQNIREYVKQLLEIKLRAIVGEWYLNIEWGGFDKNLLFNKKANKDIVDAYYKNLIRTTPHVLELTYFSSKFERATRIYSFEFEVETEEGGATFGVNLIPPNAEVDYTFSNSNLNSIGCVPEIDIEMANRLYVLLNIEIPLDIPWGK